MGVCLYIIIALTISDTFGILDFMNYPFPVCHNTQYMCETLFRFARILIASAKCLDMSIELRLKVTERISCGFQRPNYETRIATPKHDKSSGSDSNRLQKHRCLISTPN